MKSQKLLDALKTIKKYCEKQSFDCEGCLFKADSDRGFDCCLLSRNPCDWHPWKWITDDAFKEIDMDRDYRGF